jgi:hypothetical protein
MRDRAEGGEGFFRQSKLIFGGKFSKHGKEVRK